jgi:hypothetical protein
MSLKMSKMKRGYEKHQKGGTFWNPPVGETLVYVHGQCRSDDKYEPTDGVNYVEMSVHYNVGPNNSMIVSLNKEVNPIIVHPFVKEQLKSRKTKFKIPDVCPMEKALEDGTVSEKEADESRRQTRFMWGLTPLKYRTSKEADWQDLPPQPSVAVVGKTIFDGLMEQFIEVGDISNPEEATLVLIRREGKDKLNTKYKISIDAKTLRKPMKLSGKLLSLLKEAMKKGGDCDLFKVVANMMKSPAEIRAILNNVKTEEDEDGEYDEEEENEDEENEDEEEEDEEDEEEDEDEENEDEEEEDEEDEEDEEEDEDEENEEENEDEEDEDEEDEEEEDEEPPPPPPTKKRGRGRPPKVASKSKSPAKTEKVVDKDEDDLGLDKLDAELDKISKGGKPSGVKLKVSKKKSGKKVKSKK